MPEADFIIWLDEWKSVVLCVSLLLYRTGVIIMSVGRGPRCLQKHSYCCYNHCIQYIDGRGSLWALLAWTRLFAAHNPASPHHAPPCLRCNNVVCRKSTSHILLYLHTYSKIVSTVSDPWSACSSGVRIPGPKG